ncbi:MAG: autotransporter-associated beta strand repeat-containing protein [Opitutaceae bacterium]|nr:autotransporter-associated beta strand repeat-containing protein [Opitutaceae bacterium]
MPARPARFTQPARRLVLLGLFATAAAAGAADYYWDADGDTTAGTGNRSIGTNNWSAGATYLTWRADGATGTLQSWGTVDATGSTAVFGGDLAGSVNVYGLYGLSVNSLRFERTGYTITSSPLTFVGLAPTITNNVSATIASVLQGSAGLTKAGTGQLSLTGVNTFTGTTTVNGGTLLLYNSGVLNGTTAVVVNTGGTLYFQAAERINNAASLTIAGGTSSFPAAALRRWAQSPLVTTVRSAPARSRRTPASISKAAQSPAPSPARARSPRQPAARSNSPAATPSPAPPPSAPAPCDSTFWDTRGSTNPPLRCATTAVAITNGGTVMLDTPAIKSTTAPR